MGSKKIVNVLRPLKAIHTRLFLYFYPLIQQGIIWETKTSKCIVELVGHESGMRSASLSPCCNYILTVSQDNTVRIWRLGLLAEKIQLLLKQDAI